MFFARYRALIGLALAIVTILGIGIVSDPGDVLAPVVDLRAAAAAKMEIQSASDDVTAASPTTAAEAPTSSLREKVIDLFKEQMKIIDEDVSYYRHWAGVFRWTSWGFRVLALVTLAFGALAPSIDRICPDRKIIHYGYAALIIAGIAIGADHVFLASQDWSRFSLAQLQLEALRNQVTIDRNKFELTAVNDEAAKKSIDEITNQLKEWEKARAAIVEAETKGWSGELSAALSELEKRVSSLQPK